MRRIYLNMQVILMWDHSQDVRFIQVEKLAVTKHGGCVQGNEGSKKTILNNGGEYESTVYLKERDVYLERYWIDLTETA